MAPSINRQSFVGPKAAKGIYVIRTNTTDTNEFWAPAIKAPSGEDHNGSQSDQETATPRLYITKATGELRQTRPALHFIR